MELWPKIYVSLHLAKREYEVSKLHFAKLKIDLAKNCFDIVRTMAFELLSKGHND